ncbi:MAG: hypothetical protein Q3998_01565 [Porphyromonas sp.]|nr:hypothetical protein [Porphyromonas sp.]
MKSSVSTVYKIFLVSAFVILISGLKCEPEGHNLDFEEVFRTNESDIYMIKFSSYYYEDYRRVVYFKDKRLHQRLCPLRYIYYPSKEQVKNDLYRIFPFGSQIDSVGVYSKISDEVLAMFYSKKFQDEGKVSSTNYSNPFLREHWEVEFDEEEYEKGRWDANIGTVTFALRKIEE